MFSTAPLSSLGHQGRQRDFWERSLLCPTHFPRVGEKFSPSPT